MVVGNSFESDDIVDSRNSMVYSLSFFDHKMTLKYTNIQSKKEEFKQKTRSK